MYVSNGVKTLYPIQIYPIPIFPIPIYPVPIYPIPIYPIPVYTTRVAPIVLKFIKLQVHIMASMKSCSHKNFLEWKFLKKKLDS